MLGLTKYFLSLPKLNEVPEYHREEVPKLERQVEELMAKLDSTAAHSSTSAPSSSSSSSSSQILQSSSSFISKL